MDAKKLRCRGDIDLADKLLQETFVKRFIERMERAEEEQDRQTSIRRQLLATSLRMTKTISPDLHALTEKCRERLGVTIPLETYVYASSDFNAACVKPEDGRLFILVSSSLLEAFKGDELSYVMGHELGHYLYGHHDIPVGALLKGDAPPPPAIALRLFAWSRYAEISADRAGAVCADDPNGVARALFRLASGLRGDLSGVNIDDFSAQVDEMMLESEDSLKGAPVSDWFSTHPFSPLRLKALKLFHDSELSGKKKDATSVDELEAGVQTLLALMEPSYLDERTDDAEKMRRVLFAGAIAVANASGGISEKEIAVIQKYFGDGSFTRDLDVSAITESLDSRVEDALESVPHSRRIQLVRDLCVVARADGRVTKKERAEIYAIAAKLEVHEVIVEQTLVGPTTLD